MGGGAGLVGGVGVVGGAGVVAGFPAAGAGGLPPVLLGCGGVGNVGMGCLRLTASGITNGPFCPQAVKAPAIYTITHK